MVSPQLEVFEPAFPAPVSSMAADADSGTGSGGVDHGTSAGHPPVTSCSLTVACNTRKQLRKVLEHRRPASISH
jgi:hypothetical protein